MLFIAENGFYSAASLRLLPEPLSYDTPLTSGSPQPDRAGARPAPHDHEPTDLMVTPGGGAAIVSPRDARRLWWEIWSIVVRGQRRGESEAERVGDREGSFGFRRAVRLREYCGESDDDGEAAERNDGWVEVWTDVARGLPRSELGFEMGAEAVVRRKVGEDGVSCVVPTGEGGGEQWALRDLDGEEQQYVTDQLSGIERGCGRCDGIDGGGQLAVHRGSEQGVLGGKMGVDRRLGEASVACDCRDRSGAQPTVPEVIHGDPKDLCARPFAPLVR